MFLGNVVMGIERVFYIHKTDDNKYTSSMFQYPTYLYLVLYSSTTREKDVVFREDIFFFKM